ncbi:MAG: UDP-glucose/GDP-mannose dehydrogenase family protein, partial [Nitrospirae bacterium]|nr:UDP-glucose/GDP-mannose dehydrogenase family protein [Nitrospirota bacterium]
MDKLSVIGLGKLGACSAACFASKGFEVVGVDINKDVVDAINNGRAPVYEPRLQELITFSKGRLKATQNYAEAIYESDITFLIVPTPSKQDGHFSDKYLQDALKHLSLSLKKTNKDYHLFVVTSTVSPGTIEEILIPLIESASGRKVNKGFGIAYNPEFIALGSVITDFLNPDMVLIGESDKSVGDRLEEIYKTACENKPYVAR